MGEHRHDSLDAASSEDLTLDQALRAQGVALGRPMGDQCPEQALVDLLSAHLPAGHPDTDVRFSDDQICKHFHPHDLIISNTAQKTPR